MKRDATTSSSYTSSTEWGSGEGRVKSGPRYKSCCIVGTMSLREPPRDKVGKSVGVFLCDTEPGREFGCLFVVVVVVVGVVVATVASPLVSRRLRA